jgi:hypothetical protein
MNPIIPRVSYVSKVFIKTTILKKGYFIYDRQERLPIKIDEATANPAAAEGNLEAKRISVVF